MNTRRAFLQTLVAGAGLTSLSAYADPSEALFPQAPADPTRKLRVALMGLGSYATRVADAMRQCTRASLVGIVTGTPSKIPQWQQKYGIAAANCYTYDTLANLKNNPNIDVVYIITPNSLHHKHVLQVAATGKHVICEKPLADNARQAVEMIEACEKAGVRLYVGYRMHFEPYTRELIRMRVEGELGKIENVNTHMGFRIGDPTQWRLKKALAGGGALMDVGVYCINGARYAAGEEPVWVTAQETKTDPIKFAEVDETITFQLGFPSGLIAVCSTTYGFNSQERLFVSGTKGFCELSPAYGYGPIQGRTHKGAMNQPVVTHQTAQMDGFAACILDNAPNPNVTGYEGLRDMRIVDAIYESIRLNGQKVHIG